METGIEKIEQIETNHWSSARVEELLRKVDEEGLDYKDCRLVEKKS